MKTITETEASQRFTDLLHDAASGAVITILSRGKPIATLGPPSPENHNQASAQQQLLKRLRSQQFSGARNWTRDELYEN
jgi:antitoxin (DNA-binding transcriptional repressor) of toxin-antitoxin stability system